MVLGLAVVLLFLLAFASLSLRLSPVYLRFIRFPPGCSVDMSLDVTAYWLPAELTAMGMIKYGPDEVALYSTQSAHIDIECGGSGPKHTHTSGHAHVTSHRIVWIKANAGPAAASATPAAAASSSAPTPPTAIYLPLESVDRAELKPLSLLSFGFSTPKVIVHLHDPSTLEFRRKQAAALAAAAASPALTLSASVAAASSAAAAVPPARSSLPRYARLCFRNEPPTQFLHHLNSSLTAGVFRHVAPNPHAAVGAGGAASSAALSEFTTTRAGIGGIERDARKRERAIDRTLEQAFQDLDALMANAKQIVDLSTRLAAQQASSNKDPAAGSSSGGGGSDQKELDAILVDMGITNPVTKQMAGSEYHLQLAKQMADFLPAIMQREGGMLLLTDVYCVVNRARGTQLISPLDCLTACQLFSQLEATSLRLKEFDTGVKAVVADARTEENIAARIQKQLLEEEAAAAAAATSSSSSPYASLSPLRLSNLWHISIILAKQYLCVAEQLQVLCRDESTHGLAFALNHFATFTPLSTAA